MYKPNKMPIEYIWSLEDLLEYEEETPQSIVSLCRYISKIAHEGQIDKSGLPYYFHPKIVSENCNSKMTKAVAYLHDVIEDTEYTEYDLLDLDVPEDIVSTVVLLTHDKNEEYMDYIKKISKNPIASEVKYSDIKHNTDLARTNGKKVVSDEKWDKYQKSLKLLNDLYSFE